MVEMMYIVDRKPFDFIAITETKLTDYMSTQESAGGVVVTTSAPVRSPVPAVVV